MKLPDSAVSLSPEGFQRRREELAFLPAALEIVETPPSPIGRAIAATLMSLFFLALMWAIFGWVDIISSAKGRIVPTGRVKVVQPFETGVVRAIDVRDGQRVKAGDVLVELDPTADQADVDRAHGEIMALDVAMARLRAARSGVPDPLTVFHPPAAAPADLVATERQHLIDQVTQQRTKLASLDRQRAEKDAERATAKAKIDGYNATISVLQQQVALYRSLLKSDNVPKVQYLQTLENLVDQQHQLTAQRSQYEAADAAVAAIAEAEQEAQAEYQNNLSDELAKDEAKETSLAQDLVKAQKRTALQVLRAPVDGVVQQLAIHTVGGVVTPAQPLLVVVPADSQLEITAMIPNHDIGFVYAGQKAQIKVDAFDYTKYGLLHGRVVSISRDSIATPKRTDKANTNDTSDSASEPFGEQLLYSVHIALDRTRMEINGKAVDLRPGMAVTAEIKTGSQRIISYLLSPLARYAHNSLRER